MKFVNHQEWLSKPRIVLGLMTGTSLDGIDLALCKIGKGKKSPSLKILCHKTYAISDKNKGQIKEFISGDIKIADVSYWNFKLSQLYNEAIDRFILDFSIDKNMIELIGCHGQTVWHQPKKNKDYDISSTLQLGSGSVLAKLTGIPVVSDFRVADVSLGGQGAPLVPIFDYYFLKSDNIDTIALNLGGIANITFIPKGSKPKDVIAFDTGPANVLIDTYCKLYFNKEYDKGGNIGRKGKVNKQLLIELLKEKYIYQIPPKSTGRELFNSDFVEKAIKKVKSKSKIGESDLIATLTEFSAICIMENIKLLGIADFQLIYSGGGAANKYLMQKIQFHLSEIGLIKMFSSDKIGIGSYAKEATAFAFLAWLNLAGFSANLPSVTGASKDTILGCLSY